MMVGEWRLGYDGGWRVGMMGGWRMWYDVG